MPNVLSIEDRGLLEDPSAREIWRWLVARHPDGGLTPDSSLERDLGIDSIGWLHLALEIEARTGIKWSDARIMRVETVRDLLREIGRASRTGQATLGTSFLDAPQMHLGAEQARWIEPLGPGEIRVSRRLHRLNRTVMRGVFGLRTAGAEHLPDGQVAFTSTHGSFLDALVIAAALDHARLMQSFWAADAELAFGKPLIRRVSRLAQAFPFDAERGFLAGTALAAAVLKRGHNLIWFPEGARARSTELQAFRRGIGMLLERVPVPVVPIAISGAHEAYPPGRLLPRPHPVTVAFGDVLDPGALKQQGEGKTAEDRITNALRRHMVELHERTRSGAQRRPSA